MAKEKQENNSNNDSDNINLNIEDISEDDLLSLELLRQQILATIVTIYGSCVSYTAALEGIQVILGNYTGTNRIPKAAPDMLGLQATYIFIASRLIFNKIAFTRYGIVRRKAERGEFKYSLNANLNINTGNLLALLSDLYFVRGAEQIVLRDTNQPIFGI